MNNFKFQFPVFLFVILMLSNCVDHEFDEPPEKVYEDPNIEVTHTIADIKALHVPGIPKEIEDNMVIRGTVISFDEPGNFYKKLVIQDETGGIEIQIDATDLYLTYPLYSRVVVKCQGLFVGDYNGLIQLGAGITSSNSVERIPNPLLESIVYPGIRNIDLQPAAKSIEELSIDDVSTLVSFGNVQFTEGSAGLSYADAVQQRDENRDVIDCFGNLLIVRSSGYADFAATPTPEGNGDLTGVLEIFRNDFQMKIRGTDDVNMEAQRCDASTIQGDPMSVAELRAIYSGSTTSGPENKKIAGIVISDAGAENVNFRNVVLQDEGGSGIVVRFTDGHPFDMGDKIEVSVAGVELSEYNGLLQLNEVPLNYAAELSTGNNIIPNELTLGDVLADFENLESTLVKVSDVLLSKSGGTDYAFSVTMDDGTGTIDLFTLPSATFADDDFPTDTVSITGIVSQGGSSESHQISLRNLSDIKVTGGNGGTGSESLNEDFQSVTNDVDIAFTGWTNVAEKGSRYWRGKVFDGNGYAQATAYNATDAEIVSWLVTPGLDLNEPKELVFESAQAFYNHDGLSVWISTDFGGDVTTATWTELTCTLANSSSDDHAWIGSGDVDLSSFSGTGYIAFKYDGNPSSGTTSYRIDNVIVKDKD